jgi:hypothetical protein
MFDRGGRDDAMDQTVTGDSQHKPLKIPLQILPKSANNDSQKRNPQDQPFSMRRF